MNNPSTLLHGAVYLLLLGWVAAAAAEARHELDVVIDPASHRLTATDRISVAEGPQGPLAFVLHAGLNPTTTQAGASVKTTPYPAVQGLPLERVIVEFPERTRSITLRYAGEIYHPIEQLGAEYARSFSVSPGLISDQGVYLSGSSYWVPHLEGETMTFSMAVTLPAGWRSISQGARSQREQGANQVMEMWTVDKPQQEIYLVAGAFEEYAAAGAMQAMVFLRKPDPQLARKYLDATAQYVELYRNLIGPYPYAKFALVENFWETGYGMPSFTLLGPRVIRLPFILHSSFPHEILHNWWGNGVYVDYERGNWAEGLTSYLADHLIKAQRGQGVQYRRQVLQKYTDYVRDKKDFALTAFRSRHSAVSEAVGYGKTLMLFHMLRQQLGDAAFVDALRQLYRRHQFKVTTFDDVARVFEEIAGKSLATWFDQWVNRTGAPLLRVHDARATPVENGFELSAVIEQTQGGQAYQLVVPVAVHMMGADAAYETRINMHGARQSVSLTLPARPVRLEIDPQFDVFRRLDRNEIPPALSHAFGADRALIVLPSAAPKAIRDGYRDLARSWSQARQAQIDVKFDNELETLPTDRAVWVFGWENQFRSLVNQALADYRFEHKPDAVSVEAQALTRAKHSVVLLARQPRNPNVALAWVATDAVAAMPGLGRKLPHYGKYSYLAFTGDEPSNVVKGQWPVVNSPMSVAVRQADGQPAIASQGTLAPRPALAQMPPVFSSQRMLRDIESLAAPGMMGRGLGTPELERAGEYIAEQFRTAGLQPGGERGGYFQTWSAPVQGLGNTVPLRNVVGVLPGTQPELAGHSVVIGAHYDHLGRGWPDVRQGNEGKVHPGADDNASGVAVMLELARVVSKQWQGQRSVAFVAFTGEEAGKLGSRYYVQHASVLPVDQVIAMLNLDTVGRLGDNPLFVLGTDSAREWVHIFRGAGFVTGVPVTSVADEYGSSDHTSFLKKGVPAVQLFSGANADFHRPSDTADKIDAQGLVKTAAVLKEAVEYLASRLEPLHVNLADARKPKTDQRARRRVLLGTVPDFAFRGLGVRLSGVTAGTPADKAGLQTGDIIVRLNGTDINDLRAYSNALKALQPGDKVTIGFIRDGAEHTAVTQLIAR